MSSRGFDDVELMELGFKQKFIKGKEDYYWHLEKEGLTYITDKTHSELERGNDLYNLILLADYENTRINNCRDFVDSIRIFGKK